MVNVITYASLTDKFNSATVGYGTDTTLLGYVVRTAQGRGKGGVRVALGGVNIPPPIAGPRVFLTTPRKIIASAGMGPESRPAETDISLT